MDNILKVTTSIVELLAPLESDERSRAILAALTILGEQPTVTPNNALEGSGPNSLSNNQSAPPPLSEKSFFDSKDPSTKGEELMVAARFREENLDAEYSTKNQLKEIIKAARRNFDEKNFTRDLENARKKGVFNRGTGRANIVLSHYGQNYVDALPSREAIKGLRKPKSSPRKKKSGK